MRYIRTKDRIFDLEELKEYNVPFMIVDNYLDFNSGGRFKIINQADTIEELIDKYVIYLPSKNIYDVSGVNYLKRVEYYFGEICYGAIWTDKGLIYVAKWNKESDRLELL